MDYTSERQKSPLTAREWGILLVLGSIQFTHILDFMIVMPLGPKYMHKLGMALTPAQFGFMVSAYAFSACISGLLAAWCIDRFDRRTALLCLYTGFALGTLCCAAACDFSVLRAIMATLAPACARPRAIPRPMPPLPPVTNAAFPVSLKGLDMLHLGSIARVRPSLLCKFQESLRFRCANGKPGAAKRSCRNRSIHGRMPKFTRDETRRERPLQTRCAE